MKTSLLSLLQRQLCPCGPEPEVSGHIPACQLLDALRAVERVLAAHRLQSDQLPAVDLPQRPEGSPEQPREDRHQVVKSLGLPEECSAELLGVLDSYFAPRL